MTSSNPARYDILCPTIKAIAHPLRLYIVELLTNDSLCVSNISTITQTEISVVSHHLNVLAKVGIVSCEKQGKERRYHLLTPCISEFIGCIEKIVTKRSAKMFAETKQALNQECFCSQQSTSGICHEC